MKKTTTKETQQIVQKINKVITDNSSDTSTKFRLSTTLSLIAAKRAIDLRKEEKENLIFEYICDLLYLDANCDKPNKQAAKIIKDVDDDSKILEMIAFGASRAGEIKEEVINGKTYYTFEAYGKKVLGDKNPV